MKTITSLIYMMTLLTGLELYAEKHSVYESDDNISRILAERFQIEPGTSTFKGVLTNPSTGEVYLHLPCTITIDLGPVSNITVESSQTRISVSSIREDWKENKFLTSIKPTVVSEDAGDGIAEISSRIELVTVKTFVNNTLVSDSNVKIEGPPDQINVTAKYRRKISSLFGTSRHQETISCTGFKKSE